ncbi:discoidin domain-containing protein [Streptomyces jeddahensis]|uniref:O-glycosyl hydrolase family 30 n=1 Tax=Streptomyces jeddahensis TaxID=1716141 RepID=A0A177HJ69_9ACTN|nr:discoidin domain-containing protein [Streptomyces jeddahensis]OAH10689.1 O-glycosyl hydrolase family 30 [Streptomyces jeddahensis]
MRPTLRPERAARPRRRAALTTAAALLAALPTLPAATPASAAPALGKASVWLTDLSTNTHLSKQPSVPWKAGPAPAGSTITVDTTRTYQPMTGFGASFTDSSAWLVGTKLDSAQRDALMRDLFSRRDGIGLSALRQPMGASDFTASGNYSYDDMPAGQSDPTLANFTIDHDRSYTLPLLKQARKINPQLTLMATPWSPPGWMKTSDSMVTGRLKQDAYQPYADYFAKFLKAYAAAGVPVRYITPQNEPLYEPAGYPGMYVPADQEKTFITRYLAPTLRAEGLSTRILGYDHNWDVTSYPESLYADPASAQHVTGTAWHCYAGNVVAQSVVHNDYPNKPAFQTECSGGSWEGDEQGGFAGAMDNVINGPRNWAQSIVRWNIALDADSGPTNNGCLTCRPVVTVSENSDGKWSYTPTADYWALAQASKFVQPGARRVASSTLGKGSIEDVAFTNPDGSTALVTYNSGSTARTFSVGWGDRHVTYTLAAGAAATFTWTGTQEGSTDPAAIGSVDVPFRNSDGSKVLITYDSSLLAQQAQVRIGDQWLGYTLPTGASLTPPTGEVALPRDGWQASASASSSDDPPSRAIDGDAATRWSSGHGMQSGDWFQVDLGSTQTFDQIVLDTSASPGDFARQYEVYTSDDGTTWGKPIATGPGSTVTRILLPTTTARYIRVVNKAGSGSWWSIHDISVLAPDGKTNPSAGTDNGVQRKSATLPDATRLTAAYNAGTGTATFDVPWRGTTYSYRLPAGAAAIFTTRPA